MNLQEIGEKAEPLCSRYGVNRLDLFGSCAKGGQHAGSDIDFCVSFHDASPSEYAKNFFGLLHGLEDALHSSIDLLTAPSIKKISLRNDIAKNGICIYGR